MLEIVIFCDLVSVTCFHDHSSRHTWIGSCRAKTKLKKHSFQAHQILVWFHLIDSDLRGMTKNGCKNLPVLLHVSTLWVCSARRMQRDKERGSMGFWKRTCFYWSISVAMPHRSCWEQDCWQKCHWLEFMFKCVSTEIQIQRQAIHAPSNLVASSIPRFTSATCLCMNMNSLWDKNSRRSWLSLDVALTRKLTIYLKECFESVVLQASSLFLYEYFD